MKQVNEQHFFYMWGLFLALLATYDLQAQTPKIYQQNYQAWAFYATTTKISPKYSIWNDVHINPTSFAVLRTGLSRHFAKHSVLTAGYAYVVTATPLSDKLTRHEHRPWGQLFSILPIPDSRWRLHLRLRYDARFRQKLLLGEVTDEWNFNHRVRLMAGVQVPLSAPTQTQPYFVNLASEILLNYGKIITRNQLDQHRVSAVVGKRMGDVIVQGGYMYRYVPSSVPDVYTHTHSIIVGVIHTINAYRENQE